MRADLDALPPHPVLCGVMEHLLEVFPAEGFHFKYTGHYWYVSSQRIAIKFDRHRVRLRVGQKWTMALQQPWLDFEVDLVPPDAFEILDQEMNKLIGLLEATSG